MTVCQPNSLSRDPLLHQVIAVPHELVAHGAEEVILVTSFPCGKPAGSRYESATLLVQRLKETFERDRHGKWNVCSDDVLRGLDYKDYGHFLPVRF